jgi:hypothetical protein
MPNTTRTISLLVAALFFCAGAVGQDSSPSRKPDSPSKETAASLPKDTHEGLTVSANSYTDTALAKEKFGKANPLSVGILPVEIFLHNETMQAVRVNMTTIQLSVRFRNGSHQDVDWLTPEEVAGVIAHPNGPPAPKSRRFPVGIGSIGDKKVDKLVEMLGPFALDADVVPPMATIHGFLFFDLGGDISLAEGASLYVPDVTVIPSSKALMFFEVPLSKRQ